jgi:hypothetical protein
MTSNSGTKETEEDVQRKMTALRFCAAAWDERIEVLDRGNERVYHVDFMSFGADGNLSKIGEFKGRKNTSTLYPTLMISLSKIERGAALSRVTHRPFYIVASFTDGKTLFHVYDTDYWYKTAWGGNRRGRQGEQDEPILHIPMSMFQEFVMPLKVPGV